MDVLSESLASISDSLGLGILVLSMATGSVSLVLWQLYFLFPGVSDRCTSQAVACLSSLYSSCVPDRTMLPFDKIFLSSLSCPELTRDVCCVLKSKGQK